MADWSLPSLSSTYANFLTYLKARDEDAASLGVGTITNPFTGQIKYVRASNKFQEWNGSAWVDLVLSLAGGGTGSSTAAGARTNLGIGTVATQDANNVAITGGTIAGLSSLSLAGNLTVGGQLIVGAAPITLTDSNGRIPAISSGYFASLSGANLTGILAAGLAAGGTFPAINGSALTNLTAPNLVGALPAISGAALTGLSGTQLAAASVALSKFITTGSPSSANFLRGDGVWASAAMTAHKATGAVSASTFADLTITPSLTDYTKAAVVYGEILGNNAQGKFELTGNSTIRVTNPEANARTALVYILQGS